LPPNPIEAPSMFMLDPPEHSRLRKPVAAAFTPRAVARLGDRVREVTTELLDAMAARGSVDLISRGSAGQRTKLSGRRFEGDEVVGSGSPVPCFPLPPRASRAWNHTWHGGRSGRDLVRTNAGLAERCRRTARRRVRRNS